MTPVLSSSHNSLIAEHSLAGPTVAIIGAPSGLGAPSPGQEAGPAALRAAGLLARLHAAHTLVVDWGDVPVPAPDDPVDRTARNQHALAALADTVAARVGAALDDGLLPLLLGGDHSVSLGAIRAVAARAPLGVLWFDAHGDFNTPETSPSGNVHGMVLALLAGLGPAPLVAAGGHLPGQRLAVLGARALDPDERKNLVQAGVGVFTTEALRALGPAAAVERAIAGLVAAGAEQLYVSIDLDVLDPRLAPGVATRASSGLTLDEARAALHAAARSGRVAAVDVTELFPARDRDGATARAAVSLVKAALAPAPAQARDWRGTAAALRSSA
ncbi:MAG TPA: arginase family protein [Chloroflexota bacterium]|nr:arginase family protein [Chloroflexota bacterium]